MSSPRRPTGARTRRSRRSQADVATRRQERANARIAKRYKRLEVENRPQGPQFIAVLLCLLGAALVAYGIFGPQDSEPEAPLVASGDLPPDAEAVSSTTTRLDPELLRSPLSEFERALFRSGDSLERIGRRIAGESLALERATESIDAPAAEELASGVERIGERAGRDEFDFADLEALRGRWLVLREATLRPAGWMVSAQRTDVDRAPIAAYGDAAAELETSLASAVAMASGLTTPDPMRGPDERDQRIAEWTEFAASWREQLADIERSLPQRPAASASDELLQAIQRFDLAFGQARSLARDDRLVVRAAPLTALQEAVLEAEEARRELSGLALD
ncbi:MAG: hypothetical protein AAGC60_22340 [Acidobacteriota bacterium]